MADEPEPLSLELPRLRSAADEERIELRHIEQIAAICDAKPLKPWAKTGT